MIDESKKSKKTKAITIPLTNDNTPESDETNSFEKNTGTELGDNETLITITDTLEVTTDTTLPEVVENLTQTESDNIKGTGNSHANILR